MVRTASLGLDYMSESVEKDYLENALKDLFLIVLNPGKFPKKEILIWIRHFPILILMLIITPIRQYKTHHCNLDDEHEIITELDWPCYDVFGFDGKDKEIIYDVPRYLVMDAVNKIRQRNQNIGVLGVAKLGINKLDAEFLAVTGIGIH